MKQIIKLLFEIKEKLEIQKEILTVKEVSQYLGFSKSKIYQLTANKIIPHYKVEGKLLFKKCDLDKWVRGYKVSSQKTIEELALEKVIG